MKPDFYNKCQSTFIKKGDILFSIKGTIGKIGLVNKDIPNAIPGPSLCILRIRDSSRINADSLCQFLRSTLGQRIINLATQGATIPFLPIKELKSLTIVLPALEEQKHAQEISKRSKQLFKSITKSY